jgi:hypothetical protein
MFPVLLFFSSKMGIYLQKIDEYARPSGIYGVYGREWASRGVFLYERKSWGGSRRV